MSDQTTITINTDIDYWDGRWKVNDISFHKASVHPFLEKHLEKLTKDESSVRILFPFCGKAVDMAWLSSLGHEIVGIEYVKEACEQFFTENNIKFSVTDLKDFKLFSSENNKIKLYCGDFFKFTTEYESEFGCVWDRGALVALPQNLRIKYSEHIQTLLQREFRYLLDTYDYDQELYPGPPHSVRFQEVQKLYGSKCRIDLIDSVVHPRPFNEKLEAVNQPFEKVYLLTNKNNQN